MKSPRQEKPEVSSLSFDQLENSPHSTGGATFEDNRIATSQLKKVRMTLQNSPSEEGTTQLRQRMEGVTGSAGFPIQRKSNQTGLPAQLKSGVENLSGYAMDDVKVHYNSSKPAQLKAHAYAQGTEIHLGPGQEKHLPHETWHVVQQKQGRVKPTMQMKGKVAVNDDTGLEKEADVMGAKAMQSSRGNEQTVLTSGSSPATHAPIQRYEDLDAADYDLQLGQGMTLSTVQEKQLVFRDNPGVNYQPALNQPQLAPRPARKKPNMFAKAGIRMGLVTPKLDLPRLDPPEDQNYLQAPEYLLERPDQKIANKAGANMRVSDDGSMAINSIANRETKEFYAVDRVFNAANDRLAEVESDVKLIQVSGAKIKLRGSNTSLTKVIPKRADSTDTHEEFEALVRDICIDMASGVMGNKNPNHQTLMLNGGNTLVPMSFDGRGGDDEVLGGIREESRTSSSEEKMGINQHAQPDVGEGYGVISLPEKTRTAHPGGTRWGYHFAAVVAKSLDGNDTITLENYNRKNALQRTLDDLVQDVLNRSQAAAQGFRFSPEAVSPILKYTELKQFLLNVNRPTADSMFRQVKNHHRLNSAWFFQMFGSGEGQTFHEASVAGNSFVDPITLRVRKGGTNT